MAMKLALALGRTLEELGETMSAAEFGLWCELNQQEPWEYTKADILTGVQCATIANYAGKMRKKDSKPAVPSDFMPFLKQEEVKADIIDPLSHFGAFK
jgi:hypothetical protein